MILFCECYQRLNIVEGETRNSAIVSKSTYIVIIVTFSYCSPLPSVKILSIYRLRVRSYTRALRALCA